MMKHNGKKLWSGICVVWALVVALFALSSVLDMYAVRYIFSNVFNSVSV